MKSFSRKKEITIHILFWLVYLASNFITVQEKSNELLQMQSVNIFSVTFMITAITIFYLNYFYILEITFNSQKLILIIFGFIFIIALFILFRYFLEEIVVFKITGYQNYFNQTTIGYYILDNLHWASIPVFFSSSIWIIINFIRSLQNQILLTEEKKATEIQFLKSPINPHFIFNTLNNIYSLVFSKSDSALLAIEKLSEIMRFTTYETQKDKIETSKEINYIKSLIELENLRHSEPIAINLEIELENENQKIPPFLILPFIENCIKHAVLKDVTNPAIVSIKILNNKLTILSQNKKNSSLKDESSGIGLFNLKKRLDFYFPNKYKWEIKNENNYFHSLLIIEL
jgi:two-component system LytT family sensor kinase